MSSTPTTVASTIPASNAMLEQLTSEYKQKSSQYCALNTQITQSQRIVNEVTADIKNWMRKADRLLASIPGKKKGDKRWIVKQLENIVNITGELKIRGDTQIKLMNKYTLEQKILIEQMKCIENFVRDFLISPSTS